MSDNVIEMRRKDESMEDLLKKCDAKDFAFSHC